jgi:hypothetical protein
VWTKHFDFGGHRDWRLPTKDELSSLVQSGGENPSICLKIFGFKNVLSSNYWSATQNEGTQDFWVVYMGSGNTSTYPKSSKHFVLPVRSVSQ